MAALADARITPAAPLQALQSAAQAHGIDLLTFALGKPAETVPAIEAAKAAGAGAINFLVFATTAGLKLLHLQNVRGHGLAVFYSRSR
jgi:hypothetical protein